MAQTTHFFAGANSGAGFQNLFPQVIDVERAQDFMILKGGPGVGKSTFMRELGRTMEAAGVRTEYLWCSGDPDSLDGVVFPELGCAAADGTFPHVLEPRYPAAVDRYVDLGRFYDLTAAKAAAAEVKERTRDYKAAYGRAYRALSAARQVELENIRLAAEGFDEARARRRVQGILQRELRRRGNEAGESVYRFLGSLTYRGYVWRWDSVETLCPKVYEFSDSWELAGPLLKLLRDAAAERGWNHIVCAAPEAPERMEHLLIPSLGLAFVSSRTGMEYEGQAFRRIRLDAMTEPGRRGAVRFRRRMADLLRREAVEALGEAKKSHDALEAIYNPYVDFDGVRALAALEAGRLLSRIG